MKTLTAGATVLAFLMLANLVAAGVVLGLGLALQAFAPGWQSPWPWYAITGAGVLAAVLFLKTALSFRPSVTR